MVRIPSNVATVVDLLESKNISWSGYFEDMPGPGYMGNASDGSTGDGAWDYVRKHKCVLTSFSMELCSSLTVPSSPFVSFDSITNEGERLLNLDSFDVFQRALKTRQVPQFVFMSPNMMNDGHNTTLEFATQWSHKFLEPLLADNAFDERTLIMLTYDESEDYSKPNHIATLLLGSAIPAKLKGTTDDTFYTHYSILSTIEANWKLPHLGRYDVGANVFQFVADWVGYTGNRDPPNAGSVNNSLSYPGALNSDTLKVIGIPPPNTKLIGASGLGILDQIRAEWSIAATWKTPYDGSGKVFDGDKNLPVYGPPAPNHQL